MKRVFLVLCIVWFAFIINNTCQSGTKSNNISYKISTNILKSKDIIKNNKEYNDNIKNDILKNLNYFTRKFAHGFEFGVLAILLYLFFNTLSVIYREKIIYTLFLVLLAAVTDEFIQLFITLRTSSVKDVLIDFFGGIIGVIIISFTIKIINKNNQEFIIGKNR